MAGNRRRSPAARGSALPGYGRPVAFLTALVALAICAAPAGAVIKTVSKSRPVNPGGTASATASCGAGTTPVSAGFFSSVSFDSGGVVPLGTVRLAGGSSVTGINTSSAAHTITDFAYCDTDPRAIVARSLHVQLPIKHTRAAKASCPAGSVPISGGYQFSNGAMGSGAAFRSRRVSGGWEVAGYNDGPGKSSFTVFVYCQKNGPQIATRASTKSIQRSKVGSSQTACAAGTRVVSGGFDGHLRRASGGVRVAFPIGSNRVTNTWRATAVAGTDLASAKLTSYAYCEPA